LPEVWNDISSREVCGVNAIALEASKLDPRSISLGMRAEAENAKKVQRVEDTPAGGKEPSSSAAASAPV
jgi:hypothetical protein